MSEDTQRVEIRRISSQIVAEFKIMSIQQRRSIHLIMAEALAEYIERHNSKPPAVDLDAALIGGQDRDSWADRPIGRRP